MKRQISFAAVKGKKKKKRNDVVDKCAAKRLSSTLAGLHSLPREWDAAAKWNQLFLPSGK